MALQLEFLRLTGAPLNSVKMIPPQVLAHLGGELGIAPPRLASIRALYRRRRTLFEHQDAAKQALGLRDLTVDGERALNGFLRRETGDKFLVDELEQAARAWLHDHCLVPEFDGALFMRQWKDALWARYCTRICRAVGAGRKPRHHDPVAVHATVQSPAANPLILLGVSLFPVRRRAA